MNDQTLNQFLIDRDYRLIQMKRSETGHFEINVKIDNNDLLLIVDTGASKTVLHNEKAKSIGITVESEEECGGGLGTSNAAVGSAIIKSFMLSEMIFENFSIYIMDFSHVITAIKAKGGNEINGVIGADILGSRSAIIDYEEAKLYLKTSN